MNVLEKLLGGMEMFTETYVFPSNGLINYVAFISPEGHPQPIPAKFKEKALYEVAVYVCHYFGSIYFLLLIFFIYIFTTDCEFFLFSSDKEVGKRRGNLADDITGTLHL